MDGSNKCKSLRSENSNYIFRGIHLQQAKQASEFYYTYGEARRAELRMWVKRASTFYHIYVQQSPKGWAEYASEASMWVLSYIWRLARFEGPILGCDWSELLSSIINTVRPRIWKPRIWKKPRLWKKISDYRFLFNKITPNLEIFEKMGTPDMETIFGKNWLF